MTRLDAMLRPIGLAALELLTSPQLYRIKKCAAVHGCFLISPRTSADVVCHERCGTHEKIRRYVSRGPAARRAVVTRCAAAA